MVVYESHGILRITEVYHAGGLGIGAVGEPYQLAHVARGESVVKHELEREVESGRLASGSFYPCRHGVVAAVEVFAYRESGLCIFIVDFGETFRR